MDRKWVSLRPSPTLEFTVDEKILAGESQAETSSSEDEAAPAAPVAASSTDALDGIEDIDFLLEEIENKIAPLALA